MQWTYAALEEMARLYVAPLPRLPMLVMLGSDETVVSSSIIRSQVAKMAEGALLELPGARHEIFMERPEIQAEVWRADRRASWRRSRARRGRVPRRAEAAERPCRPLRKLSDQATSERTRARSKSRRRCASGIA